MKEISLPGSLGEQPTNKEKKRTKRKKKGKGRSGSPERKMIQKGEIRMKACTKVRMLILKHGYSLDTKKSKGYPIC